MMRSVWLLSLVMSLLFMLSSCIPVNVTVATPGMTPTNPIYYSDLGIASVMPGEVWYIETFRSPEHFGYSLADRNDALNDSISDSNPRVGDTGSKVLNSSFSIIAQDIPEGWSLRLQNISLVREVSDVDETIYSFFDTVRLLLAVDVPFDAFNGVYDVTFTVQRSTGEEQTISLDVRVTGA